MTTACLRVSASFPHHIVAVLFYVLAFAAPAGAAGSGTPPAAPREAEALHALAPPQLDGRLLETMWTTDTSFEELVTGATDNTARFDVLWDEDYLYVVGAVAATENGYAVEMAVPWSNLGVAPGADVTIGLDLANDDDDDGEGRDGQIVWSGTVDNYHDTSEFGTVTLSSETVEGPEEPEATITTENLVIAFDEAQRPLAEWTAEHVQQRITFYKSNGTSFFADPSKVFRIELIADAATFDARKPAELPAFETAFVDGGTLYVTAPQTEAQLAYFGDAHAAVLHGFARHFITDAFGGNLAEWLRYGYARLEAGLRPDAASLRQQVAALGHVPTLQQMEEWADDAAFDRYAFAYTLAEFVKLKFGHDALRESLRFGGGRLAPSFWSITTREDFEAVWHLNLDIFYLRTEDRVDRIGETDHFVFYLSAEDRALYHDDFAALMEDTYARYMDWLGMELPAKTHFVVYPTACDYHRSVGVDDCNTNSIGGGIGLDVFQLMTPRAYSRPADRVAALIMHEYAHVVQFNVHPSFMPAWLSEGFASFMPGGVIDEAARASLRGQVNARMDAAEERIGHRPTVAELEDYAFVRNNDIDYYLLGQIMVDFIVREHGFEPLKALIRSVGQDFSSMDYVSKQAFEDAWYAFYDEYWQIQPTEPMEAEALHAATAPEIDGRLQEAAWVATHRAGRLVNGTSDNEVRFGVLWDEANLYVGVEVLDAALTPAEGDNYQNDGLEIYVDADHNAGTSYDEHDRQFVLVYGRDGLWEQRGHTAGVTAQMTDIEGGFSAEIAIPWTNLGVSPNVGVAIGFDLGNNDDDDGGARDGQLMWSGTENNWQNTSAFGTVTLAEPFGESVPVVFHYAPDLPSFSSLTLAGSMNGWNPSDQSLRMTDPDGDGVYELTLTLEPGTYEYKFVLDGTWITDPDNPVVVGEYQNSQLTVSDPMVTYLLPKDGSAGVHTTEVRAVLAYAAPIDVSSLTLTVNGEAMTGVAGAYHAASRTLVFDAGGHVQSGSNTVEVAVSSPAGRATRSATYAFEAVNHAPTLAAPLDDVTIETTSGARVVDVSATFADADGDPLTLSASSDAVEVATVAMANATLTVTPVGGGTATVTVTADDGRGGTASTQFDVTVSVPNGAPVVATALADVELQTTDVPLAISVTGTFTDPDDDALSITARSSDDEVASVASTGTTVTVTPLATGTATITVTADDGRGGTASTQFAVRVVSDVAIERSDVGIPDVFALRQNYPNPAYRSTAIGLDLPETTHVSLRVLDLLGREVGVLVDGRLAAGRYTYAWSRGELPSGVYLYHVRAGRFQQTKTMVFMN